MTYNGFANKESHDFDVIWSNDFALYEAVKSHGQHLLDWLPSMTDQTLGRNIKDGVRAYVHGGGWGYSDVPEWYRGIPSVKTKENLKSLDLSKVNEDNFGHAVRDALGLL
jgi:hypothetical protein